MICDRAFNRANFFEKLGGTFVGDAQQKLNKKQGVRPICELHFVFSPFVYTECLLVFFAFLILELDFPRRLCYDILADACATKGRWRWYEKPERDDQARVVAL